MSRLLIDLPEGIETSRLRLQAPSAGMGEKMHQAIMDEYTANNPRIEFDFKW